MHLSLTNLAQQPGEALMSRLHDMVASLGKWGEAALQRNPDEPWRQFVNAMRAMLPADAEPVDGGYRQADALLADLDLLRADLVRLGADRIARVEIDGVREVVRTFGFHAAKLDIRQNSAFHDRAVGQLLRPAKLPETDFETWTEAKRLAFLNAELASRRPFTRVDTPVGADARAVLDCYAVLAEHNAAYGPDGLGALIVSMTRSLSDLLVVYLLARERGLLVDDATGVRCLLPVVPLFETIEDLRQAPAIVRDFLDHPFTRRSLTAAAQQRTQAERSARHSLGVRVEPIALLPVRLVGRRQRAGEPENGGAGGVRGAGGGGARGELAAARLRDRQRGDQRSHR